MKKKYIIVTLTIALIIALIIFGITKFINNFTEDANKSQEMVTTIKNSYTSLNQNITKYNEKRTNLSSELSSYYQETFAQNYQTATASMNEYEQIINDIKGNIETINNNCQDNVFTDSDANNICKNYKETYEKIINTYINDINNFNNIVETYNQNNENKLEKFTSKIATNYIDYNEDGKNEGAY